MIQGEVWPADTSSILDQATLLASNIRSCIKEKDLIPYKVSLVFSSINLSAVYRETEDPSFD